MRTILIYGADGGIGSALARKLTSEECRLILTARDEKRLQVVSDETGADCITGDVCNPDSFSDIMAYAGDRLDGLAYCVGTINLKSLSRLNETDYLNDFRINALGAALAVQAAIKAMQQAAKPPASVVLFSSIAATTGFPMHASVAMAKGALNGLVVSLAAELAPCIRINAIAPSLTQTPLSAGLLCNDQVVRSIAGMHPLKRLGDPEEVAAMAAFLLSPASSWMTGQVIGLDGGRSAVGNMT
ncbi:SDR family NAD(P)-dependent oxidoreductase [Pontiella desulfatans]|nr:SDR family oxidoreductase [Pontiella desulfatans]